MTTDRLSHLSKLELLGVLDFIFASQKFTERDLLYKSLRNLGRNVLHCDHLVIGTCTTFHSDAKKNARCQGFDSLMTLETGVQDGTKTLIDQSDSVRKMCTKHTNNCLSNEFDEHLDEQEASSDVKITLVCNRNKDFTSQPLCVASIANSTGTYGNISKSNFGIQGVLKNGDFMIILQQLDQESGRRR